ncbi:hypothetical protein BH10PSE8_BH10PSE8_17150 [soil metagenome]
MLGGATCDAGGLSQHQGACDPPVLDTTGLSAPALTSARVERARKLIALLRLEAAKEELGKAIAAAPTAVEALHLRARLRLSMLDLKGAELDLDAAIKAAPDNAPVRSSLAYLHLQMRRLPEALRDIETALAAMPDDPDARWIRASTLIALGQSDRAIADLDIAVRDEGNVRARETRAALHLREHRLEAAVADADRVQQKRPEDPTTLTIRILAKIGAGKTDEALDDLDQLIGPPGGPYRTPAEYQDFGRLTYQRAMLLASAGRGEEAMKDVAYVLDKGGIRAVLRLQIFLRHNGMPDVVLDGQRSSQLDAAVTSCFGNAACGRGLSRPL